MKIKSSLHTQSPKSPSNRNTGILYFCFVFWLFFAARLNAQQTDTITKIVLAYSAGGSSWGNPGIYGRSEIIELTPDGNGNFVYTRYTKRTASVGKGGKTFTTDSLVVSVSKFKPISSNVMHEWLTELKTDRNNVTADYLLPLLDKPGKKQMKRVAKTVDSAEDFKRSYYNEGEDIRELVANLQQFKGLDRCLVKLMGSGNNSLMVIDAYNSLSIAVYSKNNKTNYNLQFFDPLGQPIQQSFNDNYLNQTPVVNLNVNTIARCFLPKDSMMYNVLDLNTVTDYYIAWYLWHGDDNES